MEGNLVPIILACTAFLSLLVLGHEVHMARIGTRIDEDCAETNRLMTLLIADIRDMRHDLTNLAARAGGGPRRP